MQWRHIPSKRNPADLATMQRGHSSRIVTIKVVVGRTRLLEGRKGKLARKQNHNPGGDNNRGQDNFYIWEGKQDKTEFVLHKSMK
jgi:hypothetical protein